MFACMECGKRFRTVRAAARAADSGCPKCGGVDIDLAPVAAKAKAPAKAPTPERRLPVQQPADHVDCVPVNVEYRMAAPGYAEGFYLVRQDDQLPLWAGYESQSVMMMLRMYNTARVEAGLLPYRIV